MGLKQLEWHEQKNNGWVARIDYGNKRFCRYAHVNILPWHTRHKKGKHSVDLLDAFKADEQYYWFDSIEAAKLYVEAIFALGND